MQTVARISRLFGTDGEVMMTLYPTFPENFNTSKEPLFAKIDGLNVPLYLDKFERRGRAGATVLFADIDTERRVSELLGCELYIAESEEDMSEGSDDDEFTLEDLIGFSVEATTGDGNIVEGELTAYYDNLKNPLFGVTIEGREVLIPAAEEFIAGIDFEGERIVFLLPEGLLEL
ncbi:MAG: ribosome maturation factor RimM [Rikenellaceae bacterium]